MKFSRRHTQSRTPTFFLSRHAGAICATACCLFGLIQPALQAATYPEIAAAPPNNDGTILSELSLANFFTSGWDESWQKFPRGDGTPDMSLLRVQTNFLVQLFRLDMYAETNIRNPEFKTSEFINGTLEYAFNRRLLLGIFTSHQWLDSPVVNGRDGFAGGAFTRIQLVDAAHSSYALILKATLPDRDIGVETTTLSYALAGWNDLSGLGLGRLGVNYHLQQEFLSGPLGAGASRSDATYDFSLARTWTLPEATLGNFSTFVEAFGQTLLDGDHQGRTLVTFTPGMRATLGGRHIFMVGVDLPVSSPKPYNQIYRFTYILNF